MFTGLLPHALRGCSVLIPVEGGCVTVLTRFQERMAPVALLAQRGAVSS